MSAISKFHTTLVGMLGTVLTLHHMTDISLFEKSNFKEQRPPESKKFKK